MTPQDVAALKDVSLRAVKDILQNEQRRAKIFPGATSTGEKHTKRWYIPPDEAHAWQPWRGKGDKRKK